MSHIPNVFSPAGTPLLERTVGELVAERPGRSRVFQRLGIDFCCQGGRTLNEACERKGVAADEAVRLLEQEDSAEAESDFNPAELPLDRLCTYIVDTHHAFLKSELPRLFAMAQRVAKVHGGHTPSLVEVFRTFCTMAEELENHMEKEEKVLFPAVSVLTQNAGQTAMRLDGPIDCMIHEHDDAGDALERLQELTNGFQPPPEACNTYRALFAGLADLDTDLRRHIHLENAVLFPRAIALQAG